MTIADESGTRDLASPLAGAEPGADADADFASRLRRDQVHAALFGKPTEPARVDRFLLLEPIGAGGMGELYAAYDARLDRKIALKLVRSGRGGDKADARLLREAQALAKLSHPNVVSVYEVGKADDRVFVAMEYVRGQTLSAWLKQAASLPEPQRVRELLVLFRDAARGLAAVHRAGLAHRDFKPDNVLVGAEGRVRIVDFGLARTTHDPSSDERADDGDSQVAAIAIAIDSDPSTPEPGSLTATGTLLGTPRYMAPEQWRARRGDNRSDQFSFCVALYHALFGSWPFESKSTLGLRVAVVRGELREPPRKLEVPAGLHAALLHGLATDPDRRAADMSELLQAIDEALALRRFGAGAWLALATASSAIAVAVTTLIVLERPPPRSLELADASAQIERELAAERQRARVREQVDALDSRGEHADADAVFSAFAELPDYANTRALAQAWLDQAKRLRERGDPSGELAALGEAQLTSPSPDQRRLGLIELARALARSHRYAQLGATLAVLDEAAGEPLERSGELLTMRVREALSRRDLAAAIALLDQPDADPRARQPLAVLRELDRVTLTDHVVADLDGRSSAIASLPGDPQADPQGRLLLANRQGLVHVLDASPRLPIVHELELARAGVDTGQPAPRWSFRPIAAATDPAGAPSWVFVNLGRQWGLFDLHTEAGRVEATPIELAATVAHWACGDLFAGPGWEGWEGFGADPRERRLIGLRRRDGQLERFDPKPSLRALDSVVDAVAIADLDGDHHDELIVGVGAWWAYDVRVLAPRDQQPGEFDLVARRKLGALTAMISFPAPDPRTQWIAVTLPTTPASPRVFPSDAPAGLAAGVYMLAWPGPGHSLEIVDQIGLPDPLRLSAGDLDGDGRSELVVQLRPDAIALLHLDADDRYSALWIDGLIEHAIVDLDGDGDDELIVSEAQTGRVMVLGTGDERMPVLERRSVDALAPPPALDRALTDLWARADTLATIGLVDQAREAFAELARLSGPSEAAIAHRHSAALAERSGARRRAAELYERAADPESLERALDLYEAIHAYAQAARVSERLADHPELGERGDADARASERWRARARLLRARAEPEARLEFDFARALDPGWRIEHPGLLRREPGGLRIESLGAAERTPLLRRAIVWVGDRLEIEIDLDVLRLEWGAMVQVSLVPVDDLGQPSESAIAWRSIGSWGGGDHYTLDVSQGTALEPDARGQARTMRGVLPPAGQHRFRLRVDLLADAPTIWTSVTTLDGAGPRDTSLEFERPAPRERLSPGRYELRIETGAEPWMRGVVRVERLGILGARDDPEAPPASRHEQVLLAAARGEHERALELLALAEASEPAPRADPRARERSWLRALALEQLGRWPEALPFIEHALADCSSPDAQLRFGHALLIQPGRFGPTLRELCSPDRFLLATWAVTRTALFQHKDLPDLHRTLTAQLVDLDRYQPADLAQALATMGLLSARARGWQMQELGSAAESDLRRVLELAARWLAEPALDPAIAQDIQRFRSLAHVELALVLMTRDQHDAAANELELALTRDLAPEIIADLIAAQPHFGLLRASTLWSRIARAQLGL